MRSLFFSALACGTVFAAGAASAAIIDFERSAQLIAQDVGDKITVDGFDFTFAAEGPAVPGFADAFLITVDQDDIVEPGTVKLFAANLAEILLTAANGAAFDIRSLDLGGSFIDFPDRWADKVLLTGLRRDGSTAMQLIDLPPAGSNYVAASLDVALFSRLISLRFTPVGSNGAQPIDFEYVIDNLDVALRPIPVPAAAPLMLLGVAAFRIAAGRRKRR